MEVSTRVAESFAVELIEIHGNTCYFCLLKVDRKQLRSVDFVEPLSKGGVLSIDNAILCCKDCSARRRRRNMSDYLTERFSELHSEYTRIQQLKAAMDVARLQKAAKSPVEKPKLARELPADFDEGAEWAAAMAEEASQEAPPKAPIAQPKTVHTHDPELQTVLDNWDTDEA